MTEPQRQRALRRHARRRRPEDLEALVVSYRPLAAALARRYSHDPYGDADLEQAACEGLIKALQRFDPDRGTPFTTFAVPTILGEVRRYLRDTAWPAHVPRKGAGPGAGRAAGRRGPERAPRALTDGGRARRRDPVLRGGRDGGPQRGVVVEHGLTRRAATGS